MIIELKHARVRLALHRLHSGSGPALLLLHELAGSAADWKLAELGWTGPVYALDLSGHGHSGRVRGGAYLAERWAADADLALRELGDQAWLVGAGVSAYVALLLAAARPEHVRGAVLLPGLGLHGAGPEPDFTRLAPPPAAGRESPSLRHDAATDPAVHFSDSFVRPPDRARTSAQAATALLLCEDGAARPPWWRALHGLPNVQIQRDHNVAHAISALVAHAGPMQRSA